MNNCSTSNYGIFAVTIVTMAYFCKGIFLSIRQSRSNEKDVNMGNFT